MLEDDPFKILDGREKKKKNQGSRASLVIHNNSRVSSPRLITLGASCNARGRRSVFELVRLSSQADENELAEEDTYSRLSVVRVRACVRAREEREKLANPAEWKEKFEASAATLLARPIDA